MTMKLRYGSICSGIEAATVAWKPLGWTAQFFAEIESFPSAVLAHYYPRIKNLGDFTKIGIERAGTIDVLVGGTPCQSFSLAGQRGGLDDARGNLAIEFVALAERLRCKWVVWENVPGVLSSNEGRDFGTFIGRLAKCGYGWAYRILDAQYFGVPQRRRRVFVVGYLGDWRRAAAVLFERASLQWNSPPCQKERRKIACTIRSVTGSNSCGGPEENLIVRSLTSSNQRLDYETDNLLVAKTISANPSKDGFQTQLVTHALRGEGFDASEDGTGRGTTLIASPSSTKAYADNASQESKLTVTQNSVRRLTPMECERLQGFPDNYTAIPYRGKPAANSPRYKAIGNSMAVPCMIFIGQRIQMVEDCINGNRKSSILPQM